MSYAARETSTDAGSPVELYEFRRGGTTWRYTSGAQDATSGTDVYTAVPMKRTSIEQTGEIGRAGLRITLARDVAIAEAFIAAPPSEVTLLTVYRQHRADTETAVVWMGRVLNAEWREWGGWLAPPGSICGSQRRKPGYGDDSLLLDQKAYLSSIS